MTENEILTLYMEKKKKKLSNRDLANAIGCSESLLSRFFNFDCGLSLEKEQKLKKLINQAKEFRWQKVYIE